MTDLTAVILCGGKGERLRPFTDNMPKPLVPVNGRPILEYLLIYLKLQGIRRFILCTGYKAEMIDEFVKTRCGEGWDITCVNSGETTMTQRLLDARAHHNGDSLICYGDTLANIDIPDLEKFHAASKGWASVTVYPLQSPFGIVSYDASKKITAFVEKPLLPYWFNIGYMIWGAEAYANLRPGVDMPEFLSEMAAGQKLFAYEHEGKHWSVNTEKERILAEEDAVEFYTLIEQNEWRAR